MKHETSWSQNLDQFVPVLAKHHLISLLKIFSNFTFYGYFELFFPNDCPQGCASASCNYMGKQSAWRNPLCKLQLYCVQTVCNSWLWDSFPLFHKRFWACKSRVPPTRSTFSNIAFYCPFKWCRAMLRGWCECMPCIWWEKERRPRERPVPDTWVQNRKRNVTQGQEQTLVIARSIF